ncbi:hypothetical protein V8E54_006612 [Elaphomyces granulatus]
MSRRAQVRVASATPALISLILSEEAEVILEGFGLDHRCLRRKGPWYPLVLGDTSVFTLFATQERPETSDRSGFVIEREYNPLFGQILAMAIHDS